MPGNVATRFEAEPGYDPAAGTIVNHPSADRLPGHDDRPGRVL